MASALKRSDEMFLSSADLVIQIQRKVMHSVAKVNAVSSNGKELNRSK